MLMFYKKKNVHVQLLPTRQDKASYRLDSLARSIAKISKKNHFHPACISG